MARAAKPTAFERRMIFGLVAARDGKRCYACGSDYRLTLDHIKPRALGGADAVWNLQIVCAQ
jgi:5-methylcytosine-specific restriction endonuclease McrA